MPLRVQQATLAQLDKQLTLPIAPPPMRLPSAESNARPAPWPCNPSSPVRCRACAASSDATLHLPGTEGPSGHRPARRRCGPMSNGRRQMPFTSTATACQLHFPPRAGMRQRLRQRPPHRLPDRRHAHGSRASPSGARRATRCSDRTRRFVEGAHPRKFSVCQGKDLDVRSPRSRRCRANGRARPCSARHQPHPTCGRRRGDRLARHP